MTADYRAFANGFVGDVKQGETEVRMALETTADLIDRAELRGEARAFRKMQAALEQRAKTLGIELNQLS